MSASVIGRVVERQGAVGAGGGEVVEIRDEIGEAISASYRATRRALCEFGTAFVDRAAPAWVRAGASAQAKSQFAQMRLVDKMRLERAYRLPMQQTDARHDAMFEVDAHATRGLLGMQFDVLRERELYDPVADGESNERDDIGRLAVPAFGEPLAKLENRGRATVHVHSEHMWDARVGAPNHNGLIDERMGPIRDRDARGQEVYCDVCSGVLHNDHYCEPRAGEPGLCHGHFGVIVLPGAVWHPMAVDIVRYTLEAFCWHCGELPAERERAAAAVRAMYARCETRVDKLKFLAKRMSNERWCHVCAARRRCDDAGSGGAPDDDDYRPPCRERQCDACAALRHFRPALRTNKQLENASAKLRSSVLERHDGELGATAEARESVQRAAARGHESTGFPCEVLLDGRVRASHAAEREAYERFAEWRYGAHRDNNRLPMHGERVRAVLQHAAPGFLRLLFDSALDTCDDVLDWLCSLVPRVLPVAPNCVRPTEISAVAVGRDGVANIQLNDLTKRYQQIVRRVKRMSAAIDTIVGARRTSLSGPVATLYGELRRSERDTWYRPSPGDFRLIEVYGEIQYYYAAVISDKRAVKFLPSSARRNGVGRSASARRARASAASASGDGRATAAGANAKSFEGIMHGKQGRVRQNLMGNRTGFSARSVIVPDHNIGVREVVLPLEIAARISVPEHVNALNVTEVVARAERIRTFATEARAHPARPDCTGCGHCEFLAVNQRSDLCLFTADRDERVRYNDGTLAQPIATHPFVHETGAVVERPLRTGDYVVMNRQPTLHRPSMMAHRVRILDGSDPASSAASVKAIRLHELITDPYNADFDGDEVRARAEGGGGALTRACAHR